jgi:hypothetical protein
VGVKELQNLQGFQKRLFDVGGTAGFSQEYRLFSKLSEGLHYRTITLSNAAAEGEASAGSR